MNRNTDATPFEYCVRLAVSRAQIKTKFQYRRQFDGFKVCVVVVSICLCVIEQIIRPYSTATSHLTRKLLFCGKKKLFPLRSIGSTHIDLICNKKKNMIDFHTISLFWIGIADEPPHNSNVNGNQSCQDNSTINFLIQLRQKKKERKTIPQRIGRWENCHIYMPLTAIKYMPF